MRYIFGLTVLLLSKSLYAEVLTLECIPDEPEQENRGKNVFVVDTEAKTLLLNNDHLFPDLNITKDNFYVEGEKDFLSYTLDISRGEMVYKKVQWLNAFQNPVKRSFTGQCKIVEKLAVNLR